MEIKPSQINTLFNKQIPEIIRQLKRIADELVIDNIPDEPLGKFEEISDDEKAELNTTMKDYDKFFDQMVKNFILNEKSEFNIMDLKALCRHAWTANK
jgi:hypothetical protein